MDIAFKAYLWKLLTRYHVSFKDIDFTIVSDFYSLARQLEVNYLELSTIIELRYHLEMIFNLHKKEVYLYDPKYKTTPQYLAVKDKWVYDEQLSTENYIERFLLDECELKEVYKNESIYVMGNPREIKGEKCGEDVLSREIMERIEFYQSALKCSTIDIEGLIDRLKKSKLDLGIEQFNAIAKKIDKHPVAIKPHASQICKIIYFFYELEYKLIPELLDKLNPDWMKKKKRRFFNAIEYLSKPSMENIDYSFLGWETYNGNITRLIRNSLEKELPLETILYIQAHLDHVADTWNNRIFFARIAVGMDKRADIDGAIRVLKSVLDEPCRTMYSPYQLSPIVNRILELSVSDDFSTIEHLKEKIEDEVQRLKDIPSGVNDAVQSGVFEDIKQNQEVHQIVRTIAPIETLYSKISQFERLGEIKDILLIKREQIDSNYDVSPKYIKSMRRLKDIPICIDSVEEFIEKNADRIDKYVYLKENVTPEERRKMKEHSWKVPMLLDFCIRARPNAATRKAAPMLQIISYLQALLIDEKNDFEYFFPLYQVHLKHKPTDHLKKNKHIADAIKLYWVRRIDDHWNANLGEYEVRRKLMEYENKLYEVLDRIYSCSDIFEVKSASEYYHNRFRKLSGSIY